MVFACCAACSGPPVESEHDTPVHPVAQSAAPARCESDDDCVLNPVDCSECGRCPGDEPSATMRAEVDSLQAECARHPPARLDPRAAAIGLQRPACSPCPLGLDEPRPLWRATCKGGGCTVEPAGTQPPYQGGELTHP